MNKSTVVLILVDGLRHDYLNPVDSPFLHALAQQNIDALVRETFAFELRPAFFAGLQPEECNIANMFCYNPADSPFRDIDVSHGDRAKISADLRAEAERRGYSLVRQIGNCAEIPLPLLKYFDFAEKYHTADPGAIPGHRTLFDFLRSAGKKWLWIGYPDPFVTTDAVMRQLAARLAGDEDFIYLHFSELDWAGHESGPHSAQQKTILAALDAAIREVFCRLNRTFAGVRSVVFGDHGQVAVTQHLDLAARLGETGLILEKDYLYFLDSTQARFWFFHDTARQKVTDLLRGIAGGRILTEADCARLHFRMKDHRFGELIFVTDDHVGIFPNFFQSANPCHGLHGYLPEVEGNWAKLIVAGCGSSGKIAAPFAMTDLFPLLVELLGCRESPALPASPISARAGLRLAPDICQASVVIPTYNRLPVLKKCLAALERQTCPVTDFEVIVVNDGSADGTGDFLKEYQAQTRLNFTCLSQANAGPAAARNAGIRRAAGHIIILIGDDIIAEPDLVEQHCAFHLAHPPLSHACLGFIDWSADMEKSFLLDLLTAPDGGQQFCWHLVENQDNDNVNPAFFWTSNISFKRSFSLTHGLFNSAIFKHALWEDVELGQRLHRAGLLLHFRKNCLVHHEHAVTFRGFVERQRLAGWYVHDLSDFAWAAAYRPAAGERNRLYSRNILDEMCAIIEKSVAEVKRCPEDILRKIYNFCFRYAMLVGYKEREGGLPEDDGPFGLLGNLALAEYELAENNRQISVLKQQNDGVTSRQDALLRQKNSALAQTQAELAAVKSQLADLLARTGDIQK